MASGSDFIIRCKTHNGSFVMRSVNSESTVQELKIHLSQETNIRPECIKILCGYPPRALADGSDDLKLRDVNIHSGETIIVERTSAVLESQASQPHSASQGTERNETAARGDASVGTAARGDASAGTAARGDASAGTAARGGASAGTAARGGASAGTAARGGASAGTAARGGTSAGTAARGGASAGTAARGGASVNNVNPPNPTSPFLEDLAGGIMLRYVVPSNNSCLFTSVYYVLSNGELNERRSLELRKIIAEVVARNKEKYNPAILGMSNERYCGWIQDNEHWGGAIELSILSEHFGVEIVAIDTKNLNVHRFGESSNYANRIFLIYDGVHYDPLIVELGNSVQTIFPVRDDYPMEMAMELAREARSSRQYTDVANFTLRCLICGEQMCGDKEARAHAQATGHNQFGEITE